MPTLHKPEVSFKVTRHEFDIIEQIATRAMSLRVPADPFTKQDVVMDITAVHANGCPLRLEDLLMADGFNFAHDILGIRKHLDRETGRLDGRFLPRFAKRDADKASAS